MSQSRHQKELSLFESSDSKLSDSDTLLSTNFHKLKEGIGASDPPLSLRNHRVEKLGNPGLEIGPRRTWSLYTLSSVPIPQIHEPGGLRFPSYPEQRPLQKSRRPVSFQDEGKRRQAKLLLVSLLENFCLLYDESPHRNRKLFLVICKMLSSMGIVDEEFIDELSGVRQSYIKAFKDLVVQASVAVEQEKLIRQGRRSLSLQCSPTGILTPEEPELSFTQEISNNVPLNTFIQHKNLNELLDLYDSRYHTDFQEKSMLGKGGFGSVWMAQNKLNGIMYAIKKIRLKDNLSSYEKILREIKNLARLEHTNIVRYYSSWIEYVDYSGYPKKGDTMDSYTGSEYISKSYTEKPAPERKKTAFDEDSANTIMSYKHKGGEPSDETSDPRGSLFYRPEDSEDSESYEASGPDFSLDDLDLNRIQFTISDLDDSSSPTQPEDLSDGLGIDFVNECEEVEMVPRIPSEIWTPPETTSTTTKPTSTLPQRQLTLFIQMQLCGATLKDFLDWRNSGVASQPTPRGTSDEAMPLPIDPHANIRLFRSIVEGVKYIHMSGLIHRDLKPANIFLSLPHSVPPPQPKSVPVTPTPSPPKALIHPSSSSLPIFGHDSDPEINHHLPFHEFDELVPKIGDFGLATSHLDPELVPVNPSSSHPSRTSRVGTITYASPEQLSNPPVAYNEKSDIYSLGIIFFELFNPFSTGMERAKVLKELRQGVLPGDFVTKWPKEATFVLWLMADDPDLRPSAEEILAFELINPPNRVHSELSHQLALRTAEVEELKEENRILQDKIRALESHIEKLNLTATI